MSQPKLPDGFIKGQTSNTWVAIPVDKCFKAQLDELEKVAVERIPEGYERVPLEEERHVTFAYYSKKFQGDQKKCKEVYEYALALTRRIKVEDLKLPTEPEYLKIDKGSTPTQTYDVHLFCVRVDWKELHDAFNALEQKYPEAAAGIKVNDPPVFKPHITLFHLRKKELPLGSSSLSYCVVC